MKFILSNNIKNKNAISYINNINNFSDTHKHLILDINNISLIEAVYMAVMFITKKPITISKNIHTIYFDYDN